MYPQKQTDKKKLNESLISVGISALKLHAVPAHSKVSVGKRKIKQAKTVLRNKVASTLDLEENILTSDSSEDCKELERKASEFDRLMNMIKDKLPQVTHREKFKC